MAALTLRAAVFGAFGGSLALLSACGELKGLQDTPSPLGTVHVKLGAASAAHGDLYVALVWGAQYLSEPFCALPPENAQAAKVIARGCRDPLGFVPLRVGGVAPVGADGRAALDFYDLPGADVMVGTLTGRVAYASLVVFQDTDGDASLAIDCPDGGGHEGGGDGERDPNCNRDAREHGPDKRPQDTVRGASFISMGLPDRRVAFREGKFNAAAAFYPREQCTAPPAGFSVLGAGGFSTLDLLSSLLKGELPPEDPATCTTESLEEAVVEVALPADPKGLPWGLDCAAPSKLGTTRYSEPPKDAPDFKKHTWACVGLPRLGGGEAAPSGPPVQQLVVASAEDVHCPTVDHYLIAGCERDPTCDKPEWDRSSSVPEWWPCETARAAP